MPRLARILATVGGIGYAPLVPGTFGSAVGWLLGVAWPARGHEGVHWILLILVGLLGIIAATSTERQLGRLDPGCVVIDEVIGMWAILVAVSRASQGWWSGVAFVLFRFFDIVKPPPLKWLSRFPGGWGIMLDDVGASVYACFVLWVALAVAR